MTRWLLQHEQCKFDVIDMFCSHIVIHAFVRQNIRLFCGLQAVSAAMPCLSCDGVSGMDEQPVHDGRNAPSLHLQVQKASWQ